MAGNRAGTVAAATLGAAATAGAAGLAVLAAATTAGARLIVTKSWVT
jgi:hypothetical protein